MRKRAQNSLLVVSLFRPARSQDGRAICRSSNGSAQSRDRADRQIALDTNTTAKFNTRVNFRSTQKS